MALKHTKEGSVAPRERVNIVYKTYIGDAQEQVELPLRLLVVGDFKGEESAVPLEKRPLVGVDKDNFDEVLAAQQVKIDMKVPDRLTQKEGQELPVSLNFERLQDFSPDALCEKVPELKALIELREALLAVKGPLGNVPAFRKRIQAIADDPEARKRLLQDLDLAIEDKPKK
jgi:type VI secretion system protein ImpB